VEGRAKRVNNRTIGHIEFSCFLAFDERRSVSREVGEEEMHIDIDPKEERK
jgi:hypothetical protein